MKVSLKIKFAIIVFIATIIQKFRIFRFRLIGLKIPYSTIVERGCLFDKLYPKGIRIGENCLIASGVVILTHDHCKRVDNMPLLVQTQIGNNCFIGIRAFIMPGVTIGNEVIVGSMSVVTKDVPSNCIVAGNPAVIIKMGINMNNKAEWTNWSGETFKKQISNKIE
jgi:acetyltransferase-like isoleucine patch superfamily enzyme